MCLNYVYKGKEKKEALAKLPEMVKCWKVVRRFHGDGKQYWPPIFNSQPYRAGWNVTKPRNWGLRYRVAFHAFLNKKDAKKWANLGSAQTVIQSKTAKTDIATG